MNKRISVVLLSFALLALNSVSSFGDTTVQNLDWPIVEPTQNGDFGFQIQDDFSNGMYSRLSIPIVGSQPNCTSLDDPACAEHTTLGWWILRVLPVCSETLETDECIAALDVTENGVTRPASLIKSLPGRTWTPDPARGFPIAGTQSIWRNPFDSNPDNQLYVSVFGDLRQRDAIKGAFGLVNFSASVTATSVSTLSRTNSTCIWSDSSRCGKRIAFRDGEKISLKLHLGSALTGWLGGRLKNPDINVKPLTPNLNELTVSAEPAEVMVVGIKTTKAAAPDLVKLISDSNNGCPLTQCYVGIESSGPHTFSYLQAAALYLKDTVTKIIPTWSVSHAANTSSNSCLNSPSKFVGLVTTNATGYQQDVPNFTHQSLNYKVASLHYQPDGLTPNYGTYDLVLNSEAARCLYKFSNAPIHADISVTSASGNEQVATTSVSESNGWLHMAAYGFSFSNPMISVKLLQDKTVPTSTPSNKPSPSASSTATTNPKPVVKATTITCIKGKTTKKVTAIKPTCPKGYSKK